MIIFSLLVHQRPPAERQPFWDHYKLQNVLHSGTTPSFCYSSNRLLVSRKRLTDQLCVSDDEVRAVLSFRAESLRIPRCIRPDVTCCCPWMLRCRCVTRTLSLSLSTKSLFCEVSTAIRCNQNNNILPGTLPPLGKQLRKTAGVTSDGKCSKRGCKHVHFIFVCSRKKRKHWQTVNSKLKQQSVQFFSTAQMFLLNVISFTGWLYSFLP